MNWLARLKKNEIGPDTHPTKPTKPPFVGFVGTPAGIFENSGAESVSVNDPANPKPDDAENLTKPLIETAVTAANDPAPDPDHWCWPNSDAMNGSEINTFTARLHQFTGRGLAESTAEALADKLVKRDRDADDRRLCLECQHLKSGFSIWSCTQWRRAGLGAAGLPADLVQQLQRCDGFTDSSYDQTKNKVNT